MGKGGKGPGSGGGSSGLSSSAVGMIALFVALALVFGGLAIGDRAGWFGGGSTTACDTLEGEQVHEHAPLHVFLPGEEEPVDFAPERYQRQEGFVHFENGQNPPDRKVHVHERRPTLGCLFGTLGWEVGPDRVQLDTGESYSAPDHDIRVLVEGEPAEDGFRSLIFGDVTYEVHVEPADGSGTGNTTGNGTGG
jgi:hypothetical protein